MIGTVQFAEWPVELLFMTKGYLQPRDVCQWARTCRTFWRMMSEDVRHHRGLWQKFNRQDINEPHAARLLLADLLQNPEQNAYVECIVHIGTEKPPPTSSRDRHASGSKSQKTAILEEILANRFLINSGSDDDSDDNVEEVKGIIKRAVKTLNPDPILAQLLIILPNLRSLIIGTSEPYTTTLTLMLLQNVIQAYIGATSAVSIGSQLPSYLPLQNLRHVTFFRHRGDDTLLWPHLLLQIPSLRSLDCVGLNQWDDDDDVHPFDDGPILSSVKALRLRECETSCPAIRRLVGKIHSLEDFTMWSGQLRSCPRPLNHFMTRGTIKALLKHTKKSLRRLEFSPADDVGDSHPINYSLCDFSQLEHLSCAWRDIIPRVGDQVSMPLANLLPKTLKSLLISGMVSSEVATLYKFLADDLGHFPALQNFGCTLLLDIASNMESDEILHKLAALTKAAKLSWVAQIPSTWLSDEPDCDREYREYWKSKA